MLDPHSLSLSARVLAEAVLSMLYEKNLLSHQDGVDVINRALASLGQIERASDPEEEAFANARAILESMKGFTALPNDRI